MWVPPFVEHILSTDLFFARSDIAIFDGALRRFRAGDAIRGAVLIRRLLALGCPISPVTPWTKLCPCCNRYFEPDEPPVT
jgi:hypothetical protein